MGVFTGHSHVDEHPISDRQALSSFLILHFQEIHHVCLTRMCKGTAVIQQRSSQAQEKTTALLDQHLLFSQLETFKRGTYAKMEIFLTHSRMKLLRDQSCTAVHHHHCHRTPTWNWRGKEKLKPFLLPTHAELERLQQLSFLHGVFLSGAEFLLSCYTLLSNLPHNSTCTLPETFYWSVAWQQISVYQSLCTRITQEL